MSLIRISAGLVLAALLCAQTADVQTLVREAVAAQQAGDYAHAVDRYRAVLKIQPNDVATHVNLGVALVQLRKFDEALAEYKAADKLLPGDPRIGLDIALAYQKSGRVAEARDRFASLHAVSPQNNQVTMLLADSELQLGHDDRVVELLQPLAVQTPQDAGLAYMLGIALFGQQNYPAAVHQFSRAVSLNSHLPHLQSFYGQALLSTGDPTAAASAFRAELATDPGDFDSNLGLGQILTARKQNTEALPLLRRAIDSHPDSPTAKLVLAECLEALGRASEARPFAESLPKSAEAAQTLARIYSDLQMPAQAARERRIAESLAAAADPGPPIHSVAPDFELTEIVSGKRVSPASFRGKSPLVLVFGSYSCPNFRGAADALTSMYRRHRSRVQFLLVYIREAHTDETWQSTRNEREDISLAPAATFAEKQDHAAMCSRKLHLPFPAVVDGLDSAVEKSYNAWPSRVFVIGKDGRIAYSSRLTELNFHPEDMEHVLQ